MPAHHVWDDGVVLRPVQLVTIANHAGELRCGWIPSRVAELPNDLVVIDGRVFTVISVDPAIAHPTNGLPRWYTARPWIEPDDQVTEEWGV